MMEGRPWAVTWKGIISSQMPTEHFPLESPGRCGAEVSTKVDVVTRRTIAFSLREIQGYVNTVTSPEACFVTAVTHIWRGTCPSS